MKTFIFILLMAISMKSEFVPDWAKKAVWYQIFPERFRNGDSTNDPSLKDIFNSYPHDNSSDFQTHPWTSDWYQLQEYEKKNAKDIWFNLQRRRYGGDLKGIMDKIPYLKELGINAVYLNPIFESPSLHKYDAATYHHIDPNFGPDPEGDRDLINTEVPHDPSTWVWTSADKLFIELVNKLHENGIRIIIDGVFNHMGLNSWAFKDVKVNQKESLYKDWFKILSWEDKEAGTKFKYSGWYGVKELPELNQDENGITEGPKKYIFDITKRWMDFNNDGDPTDGIDGWRLDVAFMVNHKFWKDWRKHVKSINPQAYITAEIIETVDFNKPYLNGDEFDAVMNYNFAFACEEFFINKADKSSVNAFEFDKNLEYLRNAYEIQVSYVMQNLYDSHDTNRLLSHIMNPDIGHFRNWGEYYNKSKGNNSKFDITKPKPEHIEIMKLMVLFQMTYLGAPMIYYGDEVGMWGANDPCSRKPMIWEDLNYENERFNPDQSTRIIEDIIKPNLELLNYYKKLIKIRTENEPLMTGSYETVLIDKVNSVFGFVREGTYKLWIILNNSENEVDVNINIINKEVTDLLTENHYSSEKGEYSFKLLPKSGIILK